MKEVTFFVVVIIVITMFLNFRKYPVLGIPMIILMVLTAMMLTYCDNSPAVCGELIKKEIIIINDTVPYGYIENDKWKPTNKQILIIPDTSYYVTLVVINGEKRTYRVKGEIYNNIKRYDLSGNYCLVYKNIYEN